MNTKQRIIRTGLDLFLQHGYEKTSLNRIADQVGITKPAIYHHFKNKDELFHEVLSFFFGGMREWSSARFADCRSLEDLLRALFQSLKSFKEVAAVLLGEEGSGSPHRFLDLLLTASKRDPRIRKRIEQNLSHSREVLRNELLKAQRNGEIRGDINCETYAFQIHAMIEGATLISCLDESIDIETVGTQIFENVWRVLQK